MSRKQLFKAINPRFTNRKEIDEQLKDIETQAKKVIKKHKTLNLFYQHSFLVRTPLEAAIAEGSVDAFKLLITLGADPFFKPQPDMRSAIEILANDYFSPFPTQEKIKLFEWLMQDKESPIFTWAKLEGNKELFEVFEKAGLIPKKRFINELPIHVAIQAGRMDLVQDVISAAGSIQKAGDISRMSVLHPAIVAVLEGRENSWEMLKYLLKQGASTQISDTLNLPAIMQTISAGVLYASNVKEETVINVVKFLLDHGATLNVTNPNNGRRPLASAMSMGYKNLFSYLLEKADSTTLNHRATISPYYLIFQLFDRSDNKLGSQLDTLKLLSELKEKGVEFDKTIDRYHPLNPFGNNSYSYDRGEVSATGVSLLHFYLENMICVWGDPFESMDKHLEIIQVLIANGANPNAKATFTLTKNESDESSHRSKKVQTTMELTASEYARKIAVEFLHNEFGSVAYWIKTYQDENDFLKNIEYQSKDEQTRLHKKFHQFRNLERVLSGKNPIPYSGLPDIGKTAKLALKEPPPVVLSMPSVQSRPTIDKGGFDPQRIETALLDARQFQNQKVWQDLKKSLVDYVKKGESSENFLERVEQFKKQLQLHFDVNTDSKGKVTSYGSTIYRFFHYFDPYKFPTSWETLRKFGQDTYGIDINTQYDQDKKNQL